LGSSGHGLNEAHHPEHPFIGVRISWLVLAKTRSSIGSAARARSVVASSSCIADSFGLEHLIERSSKLFDFVAAANIHADSTAPLGDVASSVGEARQRLRDPTCGRSTRRCQLEA
jgi:hypothetical protein